MEGELLRALQEDTFLFSGLKTHAQLNEASRMLLDDDGKIKSWESFSKDFSEKNKEYNQTYLEAEHQYAVGASLMAGKWSELSEGDRYNLQYRTAGDSRVRKEHEALHNVTLPKSDAFWNSYYPPNGWRCRCTVVEVLKDKYEQSNSDKSIKAGEAATSQIGKDGKNRLEIFRFNPGKEKVIFPPKHPYNKVSGASKVKQILSDNTAKANRYEGISFKKEDGIKKGGVLEIFTKGSQNPQEQKKNKKALTILANNGGHYRMLPVIEDGKKNPDAMNIKTNQLVDIKVSETTNGKNIIQSALKEANKQKVSEVVIQLTKKPDSYRSMYGAVLHTMKQSRAKGIKTITVIYPDKSVKQYETSRFK